MPQNYLKVFTQRNSAVLLLLGFASGLPLALTSGTFQAWMTVENLDLKTIGFFSLVGQAYIFKFLWAPLMDRYTPPLMGRRRGWLLATQILLIGSIFCMGLLQPAQDIWWIALLATLVAFFSASQDIVFDAYKTDLLQPEERGSGAAISVLGYRLAMLVSGGLALWIATRWLGWQHTYWLMALLMLPGVIATFIAREPITDTPAPRSLEQAVMLPLRDFFSRNNAWLLILLLVLYKMGDAFALSLSTPFLIRGVGFSPDVVGLVNKTLGLFATIVGALYGGLLMRKMTLFRALMIFGFLQGITNLGYWFLSVTDKNLLTMASTLFLENLCGGMGTAAFVALLMTLCNTSFSATQFALLSALSAVGRVYVGPVAGWFVELYNWPLFFIGTVIAAIPGLVILAMCKQTLEYTQKTQQFMPRIHFPRHYRLAFRLFIIGCLLMLLCLPLFIAEHWHWISIQNIDTVLLYSGGSLCLLAVVLGSSLDYLALRRSAPAAA
ncbi:MAG: muropeptide MFS transporter AmpG [Enterobacteriaceae bacterium]